MAHNIHTTKAFVVSLANKNESDQIITIFTEDFGLLRAHTQGVRKLGSKLRHTLQTYSYAHISLVRGREFWRIVNAKEINTFSGLKKNTHKLGVAARIFSVINRFVGNEEDVADAFMDIEGAMNFLKDNDFGSEELHAFEIIIVLRLLNSFGYLDKKNGSGESFVDLIEFKEWNTDIFGLLKGKERAAVISINHSFNASQL